jgi:hypothetical protein
MTEAHPPAGWQPPPPGQPQQQPPPPGWQQPPPSKKRRGCLVPLAIVGGLFVVLVVIAAVAGMSSDDGEDGNGSSATGGGRTQLEEVEVTECGPPDAIGVVYAKGTAENGSSKRSDYIIEVVVEAPDGSQIGTGATIADNVAPNQSARWEALTDVGQENWVAGARCVVIDVERNESL